MNKHRLLKIAEYISIFAVLVGSTIAVSSGQIIYATVPMALSLLLNLVSRSQFEQQFQQRVSRSSDETYQQILNNIQSLHTAVMATSAQNNSEDLQQNIVVISEKIDSLQTNIRHENFDTNLSQLQTQSQNLQETLNGLVYRMLSDGVLSSYDPQPDEKGIENIVIRYQQYRQEVKTNKQAWEHENLEDEDEYEY